MESKGRWTEEEKLVTEKEAYQFAIDQIQDIIESVAGFERSTYFISRMQARQRSIRMRMK